MNSLKNVLIIAVLAAVGYGVYVSLDRNNADPGQSQGVAPGWPTVPKVELPTAKFVSPSGGPLPLSATPSNPAATPGFGMGGPAPFASLPSAGSTVGNSSNGMMPTTPAMPYPSATSPLAPVAPPPASNSTPLPSSPMASLGTPLTPDATQAMTLPNAVTQVMGSPAAPSSSPTPPSDMVRNLAPPPEVAAATSAAPSAASPTDSLLQSKFAAFMDAVRKKLDEGKLAEAQAALSTLYGNPDLPANQAKQINGLLDQLAGTVIYSRQHHLEPPYATQPGDTLAKVAQKYSIPWQLLARINGLMPPNAPNIESAAKDQPLPAGMEMKVVRGPFDAVVHLDKHELVLMVQNRYAGRFPIGVGRDQPKLDGSYTVRDKTLSPTYYGPDGVNINPNDPKNPLGSAWIGLTDRIGIHGVSDPQAIGRDDNRGAICVGDRDLQDLYGILTVGSRVTILR